MRALVDLDGVLVDLLPAWLHLNGFAMLNPWPSGQYDLSSLFPIERNRIWAKTDERWWANLPKTPDADGILAVLTHRCKEIYLVTNPVTTVGASGKILWIKKHYPKYMNRFIMGPARHVLANRNTILVDDQSNNVDLFNQYGGHGILLPRIWNRNSAQSNQTVNWLIESVDNIVNSVDSIAKL